MKNLMYFAQHVFGKRIGICLVFSLVLLIEPAEAYESFTTSVEAYQGFTMSSGMSTLDSTVITIIIGSAEEISAISAPNVELLFDFSPPVDILFGLTTDPNHPIEVIAARIAGIVVLKDTAFEDVTDDLLATLDFTERTVTIDSNDIVVLLLNQDQDEYAMLGDVTKYHDATVSFTYWKSEIPEVSTLVLLGVGIGFLISMMKRKQHNRSRKGGTSMKHVKTLFVVFVLLPLLVGTVSAAELTVIRVGTGSGLVEGGEIFCGSSCEETYPEKTVVQLKAIPDDDSRFVGWMVNGKPTEGVITIDQEDILVTAKFELKSWTPPDGFVWWYNGNAKDSARMVLDEIAVFFEEQEVTTWNEFQVATQGVIQQLHPQAEITNLHAPEWVFLRIPDPVSKEQLFTILSSLKALTDVKQASPVFYTNPEDRIEQRAPTGEISVEFPEGYSEERILAIEKEYGLVRIAMEDYATNAFIYWVDDPLEAIEISKQVYESGQAEYSYPEWIEEIEELLNHNSGDTYFADHWHLRNIEEGGANVIDVWYMRDNQDEFIRGSGVTIGIIEPKGVEIAHEDLTENVDVELSNDLGDPSPIEKRADLSCGKKHQGSHGTVVAGISSARGFNQKGVIGVAPFSTLIGYRKFGGKEVHKIFSDHRDNVDIFSNSWDKPRVLMKPHQKLEEKLEMITTGKKDGKYDKKNAGRNGLGSIVVWAGGNARSTSNSNYNAYPNSRYTIAVAATTQNETPYTERGANILVNAPIGRSPSTDRMGNEGYNPWGLEPCYDFEIKFKLTTQSLQDLRIDGVPEDILNALEILKDQEFFGKDLFLDAVEEQIGQEQTEQYQELLTKHALRSGEWGECDDKNYTLVMGGGTSCAAPLVAGGISLMLQANSNLSWRDVQHILIQTAYRNRYDDPNYSGWEKKGVYPFSHDYGFGRINVKAAVEVALSPWSNVPDEIPKPVTGENSEEKQIPEDEDGISIPIPVEENINIEFVEIYVTAKHSHWCDLEITLTSPIETTSILAEQHSSCGERQFLEFGYGYEDEWRFGSVRHFGEFSGGEWSLTIKDKNVNGITGTFKRCELKFYGTELPAYVKTVEARSGDELIYSAEWVVEENGQLEFVEGVEPQNPSADHPLSIKIVTSEPMGWISLNLFDQDFSSDSTNPTRTIQQADDSGTLWEAMIDPADFPQDDVGDENTLSNVYLLTFTGQDTVGTSLLPFADRYPKTLPSHPSDADWPDHPNAGDTVHQIGTILSEPFTWSITMPTPGDCDYDIDHGGIVCTFDEGAGFTLTERSLQALRDAGVPETIIESLQGLQGQRFATEQAFVEAVHAQLGIEHTAQYLSLIQEHAETARGRLTLHPKDFDVIKANVQYVIIGSGGQNNATWDGTYQVPTQSSGDLALGVGWEPREAWFPFREPTPEQQDLWCAENPPDYKPNEPKGPPASDTDTATLQWAISAQPNPDPATDSCQIRVMWETEDGQAIEEAGVLRIDLQPQSLCEAFQDQTGTVEATATYPWKVVDRLEYTECHIVDEQPELLEHIRVNTTHKYWPIPKREKVLEPGQCRSWYKQEYMFRFLPERWPSPPPQDIPRPTSPEEGDIAIHYECQWFEDVDAPFDVLVLTTHWTWTYRCPTVYVEGEGRQTPYLGGYQCNKTITHLTWECGDKCTYQELPGEFVPPVPGLERELTLHP